MAIQSKNGFGFFSLNFKPFGVSDLLGEMIRVFSFGNVELIFQNWVTLRMLRLSS